VRAEAQRLHILIARGDPEEAIQAGEALLKQPNEDVEDDVRSSILTELGHAYWLARRDSTRALTLAWEALDHTHSDEAALWLIREVEGQTSPAATHYRLLVEGDWPEPDESGQARGFFMSFDIVAESLEEALAYARRLERGDVSASLRVSECEALEMRPSMPKGIYRYTGRMLFPREEEQ
jgi:hypothetical protein